MGGTGWGARGRRESTQSNWGVFKAGSWTIVILTPLLSCSSSQRSDSVKPLMACLAPQYAVCNGIPRWARAEPTCTIVPRFRGSMRRRAAVVPYTKPR